MRICRKISESGSLNGLAPVRNETIDGAGMGFLTSGKVKGEARLIVEKTTKLVTNVSQVTQVTHKLDLVQK